MELPVKKQKLCKSITTLVNDWPCDLLIIIAKYRRTENCFWVSVHGSSLSFVNNVIKNKTLPMLSKKPLMIRSLMQFRRNRVTISLVPLHRLSPTLMFWENVTKTTTCIFKVDWEKSLRRNAFKNLSVTRWYCLSIDWELTIDSNDWVYSLRQTFWRISSLIVNATLFWFVIMVW